MVAVGCEQWSPARVCPDAAAVAGCPDGPGRVWPKVTAGVPLLVNDRDQEHAVTPPEDLSELATVEVGAVDRSRLDGRVPKVTQTVPPLLRTATRRTL